MSDTNGVEVENPVLGKLKITGQNLLAILCLAAAGGALFGVYLMFEHKAQARDRDVSIVKAIERLAESQDNMVKAQNFQTCIFAQPQDRREREFMSPNGLCKQITR